MFVAAFLNGILLKIIRIRKKGDLRAWFYCFAHTEKCLFRPQKIIKNSPEKNLGNLWICSFLVIDSKTR